jgi:hypothetical protein
MVFYFIKVEKSFIVGYELTKGETINTKSIGVTRNSSIIGWQDDKAKYSHILQTENQLLVGIPCLSLDMTK